MHLESIHINSFRNYAKSDFSFADGISIITGPNGSGKTNLLDAVYYLCVGKSYFNGQDGNNVKHAETHFFIKGCFADLGRTDTVTVAYRLHDVKLITRNEVKYEKIAAHTGRYPVVVIDPDDTLLVVEGSEERRRLIDNILSQADMAYLEALISYNKFLQQRNSYLKQRYSQTTDHVLMDTFDAQLHRYGHQLHDYRLNLIQAIEPDFNSYYELLSGGRERTTIAYQSDLAQADLLQLLKGSRDKDMEYQRTTLGIHRDDYIISLNGKLLKKAGSQGQKKTAIVALKLALYQFVRRNKQMMPLLLLDDIFDKLDPDRLKNLLRCIDGDAFGQIMITDTEPGRMLQALETSRKKLHYIYLT